MANVKLGNTIYNGVNKVKLQDADNVGQYVEFGGGGGIEGGYNISFSVDGTITKIVSITQGDTFTCSPFHPIKANYNFVGWSETSGGTLITYPYTPSGDITLYANFENGYKSVNSNYGSSNPSSVQFVKDANFPTSFETILKDGDTFIKIPTMYRKVNTTSSGQITGYTLSTGQIDNTYLPYPCFLKEDGSLMPYILIGKYMSNSDTTCVSVGTPGQTSGRKTQTIGNGRQKARNRGVGYQLYDWQIHKLWQDLICTIMGNININTGSGISTDAIGIEWEKAEVWIDGISWQGSAKKWVYSYKPTQYIDNATSSSAGYQQAPYSVGGTNAEEILTLGYDSSNPFINYPTATARDSSYNTYYCDSILFGTSTTHPVDALVGYASAGGGVFNCNTSYSWDGSSAVRLCYRPISE